LLRPGGVTILAYHSVNESPWVYAVTTKQFSQQINYLQRNCEIVPLSYIVDFVRGERKLRPRTVAITFDDGYADNFSVVYPFLRGFNIPMSLFVCTDLIDGNLRNKDLLHLEAMTWIQIIEMSKNDVTIGAHTVTHPRMYRISSAQVSTELRESRRIIESRIGRHADYFAYPYGVASDSVSVVVESVGFEAAFASGTIGSVRQGDNLMALNRVDIDRRTSLSKFKVYLTPAPLWLWIILRYVQTMLVRCRLSKLSTLVTWMLSFN
jgi:peptidoglycan/xylan/chitin deacetylase (PgdA/CDA1 family)